MVFAQSVLKTPGSPAPRLPRPVTLGAVCSWSRAPRGRRSHEQPHEASLVQLLPQRQLQAELVVGVEYHPVVGFVKVVVRVLAIVGRHEAIGADLHGKDDHKPQRRSILDTRVRVMEQLTTL